MIVGVVGLQKDRINTTLYMAWLYVLPHVTTPTHVFATTQTCFSEILISSFELWMGALRVSNKLVALLFSNVTRNT